MADVTTDFAIERTTGAEDRAFRMFLLAFAVAVVIAGVVVGGTLALVPGALEAVQETALTIALAMSEIPICH